MRLGYVLTNFPALSETFIRREILELCRLGHQVFVYANYRHHDPRVPEPQELMLVVRQVSFLNHFSELVQAIRADGVEHLHGSLMVAAQRATHAAAESLQIPFTVRAYSGHDIFTSSDPNLYRDISANPFCEAIVVEDPFMHEWVVNRLGAAPQKTAIIPNSFDLDLYRLREPRRLHKEVLILAIARFVQKKGLIHLVNAFNKLSSVRSNTQLWLVGDGPEESHLRRAADKNARIKFLGSAPESRTRELYADADIFCLPCIQTANGDADGVPTTILEAMAFELPVVTSDMLSTPYYVRNQKEGLLTPPGDVEAISAALERLCSDPDLRRKLGGAGGNRVSELCDLGKNIKKLERIMLDGRWRRWRGNLNTLLERRKHYTEEIKNHYSSNRERSVRYFQPSGRVLDLGCGHGDLRIHLSSEVVYYGCDPLLSDDVRGRFPFVVALGEALPFRNKTFDAVVLYCLLEYVFDVDLVLSEAARVLRPGGSLYIRVCVNDLNPVHLNHFVPADLQRRASRVFHILDSMHDGQKVLLMKAKKLEIQQFETADSRPLVSIAITAFNRERYIRESVESALRQSYRPIEVVVVDDGSTDRTRQILDEYGDKIRIGLNDRNCGIAYSKNRSLRMTSQAARYVAILDSDDYFHPNFVERCVAFLESSPEIGLVYTDDILIDATGREVRWRKAVHPWSIDGWLRTCNLRGDTWMARRDLVMSTKLHDEALTHDLDYDLFYQLLEMTNFAHLPEFLVYYRQHDGQSARNQLQLAKCHAANLVKYGYSPEYAYLRARHNPEWIPAIEEGIASGKRLRERRKSDPNLRLKEGGV